MGQFDELGKISARFYAGTIQHVDEVFSRYIACGARSERTPAQTPD